MINYRENCNFICGEGVAKVKPCDVCTNIHVNIDAPLPPPVNIDSCNTCTKIDLGDVDLTNPGLLVNVFATIRNLCPNRQVSVACILCETIGQQDVVRAVQVRQITTSGTSTCVSSNIDFCFAFTQLCNNNDRTFKARIIAHYLNPECCECNCPEEEEEPEIQG